MEEKTIVETAPEAAPVTLEPIIKMGKRPQTKGAFGNPKSKHYNPKVGARRRKEKARKQFNAKLRARGGK